MKRVRENYVTEQIVLGTVIDIESGIELKIPSDVAGEPDGGRIFRAADPIDLHPPGPIEVVRIAENRFVFVTGMEPSCDDLVMLGVVSGFDKGLGIYIHVGRPVDESDREKKRLFPKQSDFRREYPIVRLESAKHGYLSPFREAQLGL
jgi:hypothetical protein